MNISEFTTYIKTIQAKQIYNTEEDVKVKVIIPLLEFLGYSKNEDMYFEHYSVDVILGNKKPESPLLLVEAKAWSKYILEKNYLEQCLDYTLKPPVKCQFIVISSGRETAVLSSLFEKKNFIEADPLFKISFDELSDQGKLAELHALISKESMLNGAVELKKKVQERLPEGMDIAQAIEQFKREPYHGDIRTTKFSNEDVNFDEAILIHSAETREILLYAKKKFIEMTVEYKELSTRTKGKSMGLRIKFDGVRLPIGLCEIDPEKAIINKRGKDFWKERHVSETAIATIIKYAGPIKSKEQIDNFMLAFSQAIKEMKAGVEDRIK